MLSHFELAGTWWCLFYMDSHDPECSFIHVSPPLSASGSQDKKRLEACVISTLKSFYVNCKHALSNPKTETDFRFTIPKKLLFFIRFRM